jgi:hypothetical protein
VIITNTLKAILIVPVIALLLSAVIPHTQSAFAQIMKFKQHPDNPTSPRQPTDDNPLGFMVPGLSGKCGGSNPAALLGIQAP